MAAVRMRRRWSDVGARRRAHTESGQLVGLDDTLLTAKLPPPSILQVPAATATATKSSGNNTPPSSFVTLSMMNKEVDDVPECVICLDDLTLGKAIFTAECGHRFHFTCLLENVNHDEANADKCPICRKAQTQWPEQTTGLVKAHPYCTNCGKRGTGGQFCDSCGHSLAHTPTAQEQARAAAAAAAARSNVVVECPSCRIRCLVSTTARGTLQCPNGHLFQLRMPPHMMQQHQGPPSLAPPPPSSSSTTNAYGGMRGNQAPPASGYPQSRPVMRQCPTCYTRVQMPPNSQAGQYLCPHGHTFYFSPFQ